MGKWFRQEGGSCCFPVAIMNACRYKRKKIPRLCHLVRLSKTKNGGAIFTEDVANWAGLDMKETHDYKKVLKFGGILSIMHPIFNLHAVFCYKKDKEYYLVNSWLGATLIRVGLEEFKKYIWNTKSAYHWHFRRS